MVIARIDMSEVDKLARDLEIFAARAVPYAVRNALNTGAFEARRKWKSEIEDKMTIRNTWTTRQLFVEKARGRDVRRMDATLGSPLGYMLTQEEGGTTAKQGKHGVPIPTTVASGEGRGATERKRVVRRPNRLRSIQLSSRSSASSRRQRNAIAIAKAKRRGKKYVFLELRRKNGIFRLAGGKRRPRLDMVWDLSRPSIRTPKNPTLEPAVDATNSRLPRIHEEAIKDQMRRHRILGF